MHVLCMSKNCASEGLIHKETKAVCCVHMYAVYVQRLDISLPPPPSLQLVFGGNL